MTTTPPRLHQLLLPRNQMKETGTEIETGTPWRDHMVPTAARPRAKAKYQTHSMRDAGVVRLKLRRRSDAVKGRLGARREPDKRNMACTWSACHRTVLVPWAPACPKCLWGMGVCRVGYQVECWADMQVVQEVTSMLSFRRAYCGKFKEEECMYSIDSVDIRARLGQFVFEWIIVMIIQESSCSRSRPEYKRP